MSNSSPGQSSWADFWERLGAKGEAGAVFEDLRKRYAEPHRAYHTLDHILECLAEAQAVRQFAGNADALEMGIWFHDVVYDPHAADNEEQSAELAKRTIAHAGLADGFSSTVCELICATKHNRAPAPGDTTLIVDIDLSILGQPAKRFEQY